MMAVCSWLVDMNAVLWAVKTLTGQGEAEMAKRWYVVHAYSGFEKRKVKRSLEERIERAAMQDQVW